MASKPLLFIDQSSSMTPHAPMQAEYHTEYEESSNISVQQDLGRHTNQSRNAFNQMTIEEKLDYLAKPSAFLPKLNCRFSAGNKLYRGRIIAREGQQFVFEDRHTKRKQNFMIEEISDLRIIGF